MAEGRRIHNQLLARLDKMVDSESDTFRELKKAALVYLHAGQAHRCHSMLDLLERLQGKGVIKIGEYNKLKGMLLDVEFRGNEALYIIKEAEEEIRKLKSGSKTNKRHQSPKETNLESNTFESPGKRRKRELISFTNFPTAVEKQVPGSHPSPEPELKISYGKGTGFCLIINNFSEERKGSTKDVTRLTSFLTSVNCEVVKKIDQNHQQILCILENYKKCLKNSERYAYFICVLMSHGDQACWGTINQSAHAVADYSEVSVLDKEVKNLPKDADMLLAHATTPGHRAWRESGGSWFFQDLLDVLERDYNKKHLEDMLICLRGIIANQRKTGEGVKQMPCTFSTLTKPFYFMK